MLKELWSFTKWLFSTTKWYYYVAFAVVMGLTFYLDNPILVFIGVCSSLLFMSFLELATLQWRLWKAERRETFESIKYSK